jgi:hypothetical protein
MDLQWNNILAPFTTIKNHQLMRKILLTSAFVFMALALYAQGQPQFVYCEIVGTGKLMSNKVTISIDFGEKMSLYADNRLKDPATGKKMVFNSMIDALNYMGKQGWEFEQAYSVSVSNQNVYHYLMKKPYSKLDAEEQREYSKGGAE